MSVVKWIMKKPRLASLIDQPGGMTVGKAMASVNQRLAGLQAEGLTVVEETVAALEALTKTHGADMDAWLDEIYRHAADVLKGVGPFGLDDMAKAAFSLSEITDRFRESGRCELASIQVHVQALRLLLSSGEALPPVARQEILKGLDAVLARAPRATEG